MHDAIVFWLAKSATEVLTALAVALLVLVFWGLIALPRVIRQWRCKHDRGVSETSACDAICWDCGKNLGFIQSWREKHRA